MPKKSSSTAYAPKPKDPVAEEKKPSSMLKKNCKEIDEIFAGKKRKKPEQDKAKKPMENEAAKSDKLIKKKNSKIPEESGVVGPPSRSRKRTNDGLTVYTEEELGIGKADAGGTPLCPFDCSCCF
ncbi:uncharacterized protein C6G9.01c-like [Actinidia eriantha]|uniref:uncharacterized protein C6G9.01c-like n=1 Tax=Actinidia eriantha TaxID=165200 RepID=UPI00259071FA|nr:uncharacterized protein C6G9.01c-like [Actinidia eriantha]XP_057477878.1 uncharacterized protein C6G9.01c-like [Actinidia eriantha]